MMPNTKKSMMRATVRALKPSSFFMPTEGCWDDIMLLFLIRRPSSSWKQGGQRSEQCAGWGVKMMMTGERNKRRESGRERNKRWKQHLEKSVYQSVSEIRQIYLLAQRNRICLNLHLTQSPEDRRRRQALTHFISQQRVGGLSVSLISATGAANSRSASGKNLKGRWWWWSLRVGWLFLCCLGCVSTCMTIFVRTSVGFMPCEWEYFWESEDILANPQFLMLLVWGLPYD